MAYNRSVDNSRCSFASGMRTSGMTLLELLILLTIVLGIVLVALPTLKPVRVDNLEAFAREKLRYIYEKERSYFLRNGKYDRFSVLASDENGGPYLDRRFIGDEYMERGIVFSGPSAPTEDLLLEARLPGGARITVDSKGNFKTQKPKAQGQPGEEPSGLMDEMMSPDAFPGAESGQAPPEKEAPPPPPGENGRTPPPVKPAPPG